MKKAFALLVIIVLVVSTAGKSLLFFNYLIQKEYISSTLCENKSKPLLNCEGRCFLNKVINETEEKESKMNFLLELEHIFYCQPLLSDLLILFTPPAIQNNSVATDTSILYGFPSNILHPPAQITC